MPKRGDSVETKAFGGCCQVGMNTLPRYIVATGTFTTTDGHSTPAYVLNSGELMFESQMSKINGEDTNGKST